jgi:hypothetical protein
MLGKIIQALIIISLFVVFTYTYFSDGTVKDLVFWGIILLFNYIGKCTDIIIKG